MQTLARDGLHNCMRSVTARNRAVRGVAFLANSPLLVRKDALRPIPIRTVTSSLGLWRPSRATRARERAARVLWRDGVAPTETRHLRHHIDVHARRAAICQIGRHQRAGRRGPAETDCHAHSRAAASLARSSVGGRLCAAHLRQLRQLRQLRREDGGAHAVQWQRAVLGLQPLPTLQVTAANGGEPATLKRLSV